MTPETARHVGQCARARDNLCAAASAWGSLAKVLKLLKSAGERPQPGGERVHLRLRAFTEPQRPQRRVDLIPAAGMTDSTGSRQVPGSAQDWSMTGQWTLSVLEVMLAVV